MDITALVDQWIEDLAYQAEELGLCGEEARLWVNAGMEERLDAVLDLHLFDKVLADMEGLLFADDLPPF